MAKINSLRDIIQFNSNFKTAINLYLSLNKAEKVLGYIPTKSSVSFLGEYLKAVLENKEQATLLVGPYGKGKSHLLLVLLAVLSMKKTPESESAINELIDNVSKTDEVGERVSEYIGQVWDKKRFLPVLITDTTGDLNQAFLYGLNDALKRDGLLDLAPETYYSIALDRIDDWEQNYFETYKMFERELTQNGMSIAELKTDLKQYSQKTLILFKEIYPKVTAGSEFNPMALADALPLYKSVSEKLVDEYGYSGIYIVFDEFSKFIEGQNNIAAGTNMHLLQSMCELATDSKNAQVFITMVAHKSIKEYGKYLSRDLINLFTGIEGRIIEKYFVTSSKNNYELIKNAIVKDDSKLLNIPHYEKYLGKEKFKEFYSLPAFRSGFDETEFKNVIFNGCYPLNPIAAYLLLNISEKVAQNERTLFTFISNDEPHSMARFVSEHVYEDDLDTKVLYFDGGRIKNAKSGNVEKAVNECCLNVYTSTPIINNEMVNRAEIGTAQTKKARLNIVQAILSHTDTPEFYRGSNQEATIYRSLFCVTGIVDGDIREDIQLVIDEINRYIDSCCDKKVSVKGMVYKLVKAPYGMRAGVIPFYLAYVLANRREDIIVYFSNINY